MTIEEKKHRSTELSDELIALYTARDAAQQEERWGRMRRLESQIVRVQALRQALARDEVEC